MSQKRENNISSGKKEITTCHYDHHLSWWLSCGDYPDSPNDPSNPSNMWWILFNFWWFRQNRCKMTERKSISYIFTYRQILIVYVMYCQMYWMLFDTSKIFRRFCLTFITRIMRNSTILVTMKVNAVSFIVGANCNNRHYIPQMSKKYQEKKERNYHMSPSPPSVMMT